MQLEGRRELLSVSGCDIWGSVVSFKGLSKRVELTTRGWALLVSSWQWVHGP